MSKNSKSGRVLGLVPTEITTAIKQMTVTFQRTERRTQQWRSGPTEEDTTVEEWTYCEGANDP